MAKAYGGRDALRAVAYCKPDLILLNCLMPDIDGPAVVELLRASRETASIPIILQSVNSKFEMVARSQRVGFIGGVITLDEAAVAVARALRSAFSF